MKKEVLKKYFGKNCTASEAAEVELWLSDPQNQENFELFLESYWDEYNSSLEMAEKSEEKRYTVLLRFLPRVAAAASVLAVILFTARYFAGTGRMDEPKRAIAGVVAEPRQDAPLISADTVRAIVRVENTLKIPAKAKAKPRATRTPIKPMLAKVSVEFPDSSTLPAEGPKTMQMSRVNKVMINYEAINKLDKSEQFIVLQGLAHNVRFNNASFQDIATIFRLKYGVELELCASSTSTERSKEFTAHFDNVTFPDLIDEMSKEMLFSYTVAKNVIKICFN